MAVTAENLNDDKGPRILAVLWTLTGLTALIVIARMFIRLRLLKNFGIDDYLIAVAMVMSFAYCGVTTAGVRVGFGKHAAALTQENFELAILLNTVSFLFGILSFTIPKLAVTAMLTRILNPGLPQKIWLWLLVGTAAAVSCICIIILFTMCDPPEALWHVHLVTEDGATCKSVWMLVDYAIFTGGMASSSLRLPGADHNPSVICLCRSLPRLLPNHNIIEIANVFAKETRSLCRSRSWVNVGSYNQA